MILLLKTIYFLAYLPVDYNIRSGSILYGLDEDRFNIT